MAWPSSRCGALGAARRDGHERPAAFSAASSPRRWWHSAGRRTHGVGSSAGTAQQIRPCADRPLSGFLRPRVRANRQPWRRFLYRCRSLTRPAPESANSGVARRPLRLIFHVTAGDHIRRRRGSAAVASCFASDEPDARRMAGTGRSKTAKRYWTIESAERGTTYLCC